MTKKSSSAKRTFLCPVDPCPESFSFKTKAYSHLRSFHAGLGPEEDKGGIPLTKCPVCHKVNANQNKGWDLKKHCIDHIDKASKMSNEKEDEAEEDEDILAKAMKMIADDEDEDEAISILTNNNEQARVRTINKGEEDNAAELAEGEDREERQREGEGEVLDQEEDLNDPDQDNNDEYMDLEADPAINRVISPKSVPLMSIEDSEDEEDEVHPIIEDMEMMDGMDNGGEESGENEENEEVEALEEDPKVIPDPMALEVEEKPLIKEQTNGAEKPPVEIIEDKVEVVEFKAKNTEEETETPEAANPETKEPASDKPKEAMKSPNVRKESTKQRHETRFTYEAIEAKFGIDISKLCTKSGPKSFVCTECKHEYKTKNAVIDHNFSKHLNIKPYDCSSCSFKTTSRTTLTTHRSKCKGKSYPEVKVAEGITNDKASTTTFPSSDQEREMKASTEVKRSLPDPIQTPEKNNYVAEEKEPAPLSEVEVIEKSCPSKPDEILDSPVNIDWDLAIGDAKREPEILRSADDIDWVEINKELFESLGIINDFPIRFYGDWYCTVMRCDKRLKKDISKSVYHVLKVHHKGLNPFTCGVCDFASYSRAVLSSHCIKMHSDEGTEEGPAITEGDPSMVCETQNEEGSADIPKEAEEEEKESSMIEEVSLIEDEEEEEDEDEITVIQDDSEDQCIEYDAMEAKSDVFEVDLFDENAATEVNELMVCKDIGSEILKQTDDAKPVKDHEIIEVDSAEGNKQTEDTKATDVVGKATKVMDVKMKNDSEAKKPTEATKTTEIQKATKVKKATGAKKPAEVKKATKVMEVKKATETKKAIEITKLSEVKNAIEVENTIEGKRTTKVRKPTDSKKTPEGKKATENNESTLSIEGTEEVIGSNTEKEKTPEVQTAEDLPLRPRKISKRKLSRPSKIALDQEPHNSKKTRRESSEITAKKDETPLQKAVVQPPKTADASPKRRRTRSANKNDVNALSETTKPEKRRCRRSTSNVTPENTDVTIAKRRSAKRGAAEKKEAKERLEDKKAESGKGESKTNKKRSRKSAEQRIRTFDDYTNIPTEPVLLSKLGYSFDDHVLTGEDRRLHCKKCDHDFRFGDSVPAIRHVITKHLSIRPYICGICGNYEASLKSSIVRHLKMHQE